MLQKYDTKYDYTPGGNIKHKKQEAWGVGTEGDSITDVNLSYDNEYAYGSPKPHAVTKAGSTEYTYDLDGRMTGSYDSESKFKRTFTWDEEGRLLKTVDNKHTTDYRYDANGERICKYSDLGETIYASGYYTETDGKKISKHIYIGSTRVASQVMSRSCETSTTMKRENTLYYHTDHLGSSGYVTDKRGNFYEHTEYTSSGESWVNEKVTGNADLPYKYTGHSFDSETNLYYCGARYYDAKISRWISPDPAWDDPILYAYCSNNPIMFNDPTGLASEGSELGGKGEYNTSVDLKNRGYTILNEGKDVNATGPDILAYKDDQIYVIDNKESMKNGKIIYSVKGFTDKTRNSKWMRAVNEIINKYGDSKIKNKAIAALRSERINYCVMTSGNTIMGIGPKLRNIGVKFARGGTFMTITNFGTIITGAMRADKVYKEFTAIMNNDVPINPEYLTKINFINSIGQGVDKYMLTMEHMFFGTRYNDGYELIDRLYNELEFSGHGPGAFH